MAERSGMGDARRGDDGDVGGSAGQTKIHIENSYFEKLKERLAANVVGGVAPTAEGDTLAALDALEAAETPVAPQSPGYVVYGSDGRPIV